MALSPANFILKSTAEATPRLLNLNTPQNIVWDQGITEEIYTQRNAEGQNVFDEASVTQKQGLLNVAYARANKEVLSLLMGYKYDEGALTAQPTAFTLRVPSDRTFPAATAGFDGFGLAADEATAEMSYSPNGISTPMPRVPAAGVAAATASFAVNADREVIVSDDIPVNELVTFHSGGIDVTDGASVSADAFGIFEGWAWGVLLNNGVRESFYIKYDRIQLDRQANSSIDFSANPFTVNFRILDLDCRPKVFFPGLRVAC